MRATLVLRPEPGNARTTARLRALGIAVTTRPLFTVSPVAWTPPLPDDFDALMLTSANAVRHAGAGLAMLADLPVMAVGRATARAAEAAGLTVALTGDGDAMALVAEACTRGLGRLVHLAGRDRMTIDGVASITVYRSDAVAVPPGDARVWHDHVALLHSARAARRFAELVTRDDAAKASMAVAALSPAVRAAAGDGWRAAVIAPAPTDAALVACAAALIDQPRRTADKQGQ